MSGYLPHAVCYLWSTPLIVVHVIGDLMIFVAYMCIPPILIKARKGRKLGVHATSIKWFFGWFSAFIFLCGLTHFNEIVSVWIPLYWWAGATKILTGIVSLGALYQLWKKLPLLSRIPTPDELAERNTRLAGEIDELRQIVAAAATGAAIRRVELEKLQRLADKMSSRLEEHQKRLGA